MLGQEETGDKLEIQSLKGEAEDNFDFPLQLDFLNSQDKLTFGTETTPYFAPRPMLEKIVEKEESSNTGGLL